MIILILSVLAVIATGYILNSVRKPQKFPPGPKWYPIVGSSSIVLSMTRKYGSQWKGLSELAKKYSTEVLGLKLGSELVVVVYGEKNLKQVFTEKEFEGRPDSFFIRLRCLGKRMGITFTDGPSWREHRQFTVKHLRDIGFGKPVMEKEIQNAMINIVECIKNSSCKSINPKEMLASGVMNVLWRYVAGEQIKKDHLKFLLNLLSERSKAFSVAGGWLNQIPWSRFLLPELSGYSLIKRMNQQISDIIETAIEKHKKNLMECDDFIYSFLREINNTNENYTEEQLKTICLDLLIAGSQTTSNVLEFAFLVVLRNLDIQRKISDEIDSVLNGAIPCWSDRFRLPYTSAFLREVQRYYTIVPLAGPRRVLAETYIDGYLIPKDTTVLLSVGDLHVDPDIWSDPGVFRPERFVDEAGNLKSTEHMYPFGLGRRRCPGDVLAKTFIFITFIGVMQKFKIECSYGVLPPPEPVIGLISAPQQYTADFIPRC